MITIKFYNTPDENYVLNKTLNDELIKTGTIKDDSSILTPTITILKDMSIIGKNYCYIDVLKRYYFITDILITGTLMTLSLKVDVLQTYKDSILESTQVITRQENEFNNYLLDSDMPVTSKINTIIKNIGSTPFNTDGANFNDLDRYNYVITVGNLTT